VRLPPTGEPGSERPRALVDGDLLVDLSDVVVDYDDDFFATGSGAGAQRVVAGTAVGR
jgi:2,4-didehydro-3-deoxy-L-rhamnonate hydrolase